MEMTPDTARTLWKALLSNATGLIADAAALLELDSFGRARSLTVLAQEELGKALWIYETFEDSWSTGAEEALQVPRLIRDGRRHAVKYMEAFVFGQELDGFWGGYGSYDFPEGTSNEQLAAHFTQRQKEAEAAGALANQQKMAGLYVDLDAESNTVRSPVDITAGTIADDLQTAAQVVEMLLIQDHSRMKLNASTPYDSTHAQQFRLLPIAHPEDWQAASETFRSRDNLSE